MNGAGFETRPVECDNPMQKVMPALWADQIGRAKHNVSSSLRKRLSALSRSVGDTAGMRNLPYSYVFASLMVFSATVLRYYMGELLTPPFITFYPTILLVALYLGCGPSLFAVLLSAASAKYFFIQPLGQFGSESVADTVSLAAFAGFGLATALLASSTIGNSERERQHAAETLELFTAHASAAIAMFDRDMRYLYASRRWRTDYGLGNRELLGISHYALFPEIPDRWREVHRRGFAGEVVRDDEDKFERANGETQWISWEVRPWRALSGEIGGIVIFAEDITERKCAELANARLAALVQSSEDAIISCTLDRRIASWNRGAERMFGYAAIDVVGGPVGLLVPPGHPDGPNGLFDRASQGEIVATETIRQHKDGTRLDVFISVAPIREVNGQISGVSAIVHDLSARKRSETKLQQAATVFMNAQEGIVVTDPHKTIIAVNPAFVSVTGYTEAEAIGEHIRIIKSGHQGEEFYRDMWREVHETGHWKGEVWNRRKCGEIYPQILTISAVRAVSGDVVNYVGTFTDISKSKESQNRFEHLAHHDVLTDLPNRSLLTLRLNTAIANAKQNDTYGAVLFVDLDRFKTVNDSLGHAAGDELLVMVSGRLRERLRCSDILARFGGDEFIVVLEGLRGIENAGLVAQGLNDCFAEPFTLKHSEEVHVTASIGISLFPDNSCVADELLQQADAALYQAKDAGRNTYRHYEAGLTHAASMRLETDARMRRALERNEFVLHYQPLVCLADGHITGVEALIRWVDPSRGLVPPLQFIPLAEETGFIIPLGEWILRTACEQLKAWQLRGINIETMAINLSPRQFGHKNLVPRLHTLLEEAGVDPQHVELEITEGALMGQGNDVVAKLAAIKQLGVRLAIDDFGTGYSSLSYLRRFPIDKLKVDQSFVRDTPGDQTAVQICAAVIELAKTLGLEVLAEGVETEPQHQMLKARGCTTAQGYLFSRPLPAIELEAWLANRTGDLTREPIRRLA